MGQPLSHWLSWLCGLYKTDLQLFTANVKTMSQCQSQFAPTCQDWSSVSCKQGCQQPQKLWVFPHVKITSIANHHSGSRLFSSEWVYLCSHRAEHSWFTGENGYVAQAEVLHEARQMMNMFGIVPWKDCMPAQPKLVSEPSGSGKQVSASSSAAAAIQETASGWYAIQKRSTVWTGRSTGAWPVAPHMMVGLWFQDTQIHIL